MSIKMGVPICLVEGRFDPRNMVTRISAGVSLRVYEKDMELTDFSWVQVSLRGESRLKDMKSCRTILDKHAIKAAIYRDIVVIHWS